MATTYEPIEERLMSLYIQQKLRLVDTHVHLRIGQPKGYTNKNPAPFATRQLMISTLDEADLVTQEPSGVTIYEFSIWRPKTKLGQLLVYAEELPGTPGYEGFKPEDVKLTLVSTDDDPQIREIASRYGIDYDIFRPEEVLIKVAQRRGG